MTDKKKAIFHSMSLLLLCFLAYHDTLHHPFMLDDYGFVSPHGLSALFPAFQDFFTTSISRHYEPLFHLVNVSLFRLWGKPFPLYFFNITLFYANTLLFFLLIRRLSRQFWIALWASTLFAIHPMNADMLQHITFNIVFIATLCMQTSLLALDYFLGQRNNHLLYICSLGCFILALFCQEISLLFPFYLGLYLIYKGEKPKNIFKLAMPFLGALVLYSALWLSMAGENAHLWESIKLFQFNIVELLANLLRLWAWYVKNLLIPNDIVFMFNIAPIHQGIGIWSLLFVTVLIGGVIATKNLKGNIGALSLSWFGVGFLFSIPASLARPWAGLVIEPYWFYFSSIGFYLGLVLLIAKIKLKIHFRLFSLLVVSLFLYFFSHSQIIVSAAGHELNYCERWLRKSPENVLAMACLAPYYTQEGAAIPSDIVPQLRTMMGTYQKLSTPQMSRDLAEKILRE